MQATKGTVPPKSQQGLRDSWKERGLFLACQCSPEDDLTVAMPDEVVPSVKAKVHSFFMASESVLCLRLETETPFAYHPGQFINLQAPNGVTRPYSLASIPSESFLELHIRLIDNGEMSAWLRNSMAVGDSVTLRGPIGDCYYRGNPSEPLMLVGIGTGLAPLWGIVREALEKGHSAPIELIHSGCFVERLYYGKEL